MQSITKYEKYKFKYINTCCYTLIKILTVCKSLLNSIRVKNPAVIAKGIKLIMANN